MDSRTVGVLGGGQLGRMMAEAGHRLGIKLAVLDPGGKQSPAGQVAELAVEGSFRDAEKIDELSSLCDVLTVEIEHVNCDMLDALVLKGTQVEPSPRTIRVIQDKFAQKEHVVQHGIPVGDFADAPDLDTARQVGRRFGYPLMLKNKRMAYDGKGNAVVESEEAFPQAWEALGGEGLYIEKWCPFQRELAVMVVRSSDKSGGEGEAVTVSYPVVETVQKDNVCHTTLTPARISKASEKLAQEVASKAVAALWGAGIFGVELFLLSDGQVLLNEIAPRPHNSGHYTMEACECDQFENHLRAVLGLPLGSTAMRVGASMMLNVLGEGPDMEQTKSVMHQAMSSPGAGLHWYGKAESRKGRKMAHITFTADSLYELKQRVRPFGLLLTDDASSAAAPSSAACTSSSSAVTEKQQQLHALPASCGAVVGIIMGSDSDLPTMSAAAKVLEQFNVPFEVTIVSAHRTPDRLMSYARGAVERGLKVIIAGAGGAAHLPGMVAAMTSLPVVGVPVKTSSLSGVDSLYSIVQMPRGVPVATVAIGNAMNAGLLAVRILGVGKESLLGDMSGFQASQEEEVLAKAALLEEQGWKAYLEAKEDKSTTVGV